MSHSIRTAIRAMFAIALTCVFAPPAVRAQGEGTIIGWGSNSRGQCDAPLPNPGYLAVEAGLDYGIGIRSDHTITAWGCSGFSACGILYSDFHYVAVAAGMNHGLGLRSDGMIVAWGYDGTGECEVPAPNADFMAVAAGLLHSVALKADGTVRAWGNNDSGQCNVPYPNADFIAVAAGALFSAGLKADGSIVVWGSYGWGLHDVPAPNADFVAVAAGSEHVLGLKKDGKVVAWGSNLHGQCTVPAPNRYFTAVAGGATHSLGLRADGTVIAWGQNDSGACDVPQPNVGFTQLAAGSGFNLGLKGGLGALPTIPCRGLQVYDHTNGAPDETLLDAIVAVEGAVTVAPGTYSGNGGGYLQDDSGGINFWRWPAPAEVHVGDRIRITGHLWPDQGMLYIGAYEYTKLDSLLAPTPTEYRLPDLVVDYGAVGSFVRVAGRISGLTTDTFRLVDGSADIEVRRNAYGSVDFGLLAEGRGCRVTAPCIMQDGVLHLVPARQDDIVQNAAWYVATDGDDNGLGTRELPFGTIQRAVDATISGDTVLIRDGRYLGPGNVDVNWLDKSLVIASESGNRDACVIDCGGSEGLRFEPSTTDRADSLFVAGLTILQASRAIDIEADPYTMNGPLHVDISNCRISDGDVGVEFKGGVLTMRGSIVSNNSDFGVHVHAFDPRVFISDTTIRGNGIGHSQIAVCLGSLDIDRSEIVGNGSGLVYRHVSGNTTIRHCRIDSSRVGNGIEVHTDTHLTVLYIENSRINGNAGHGVAHSVEPSSAEMVASDCDISGNGGCGVAISSWATRTRLRNVRIANNHEWGIGPYVWPYATTAPRSYSKEFGDCLFTLHGGEVRGNLSGGISLEGTLVLVDVDSTAIVGNFGPGFLASTSEIDMTGNFGAVTIAGNDGGGIAAEGGQWTCSNSVVADNNGVALEVLSDAVFALTCCNLHGNFGGDWTTSIAEQLGQDGNLTVDPLFCDRANGDYHLRRNSPLTAANAGGCGTIGCYDWACPALSMPVYKPYLSDVPTDQGGRLKVAWTGHVNDAAQAQPPVTSYAVQRLSDGWQTVATLAAAAADTYATTIDTPDVLTVGVSPPWSTYRIVAATTDSLTSYASLPDSAYSVDDLPPPRPEAMLVDDPAYRYLVWADPGLPDLASACVYRGEVAGFVPGEPLSCPDDGIYTEAHLGWYFYRVRFTDTHGNPGEFSDEFHGRWPTDVPGALPTELRLHPCRPNPFNPRTTIRYDLPAAGSVRLAVYDLAGRLVRTLVDEGKGPGIYEVVWDGRDSRAREVGSGTYLARLEAGGRCEVVRLGLVR